MNKIYNVQVKRAQMSPWATVTYNGCGQNEERRGVYPLRQVKQWSPLSHAEEGRWALECRREPRRVVVPVPPLLLDTHALYADHRSIAPMELKGHHGNSRSNKKIWREIFCIEAYLWSTLWYSWDYSLPPLSASLHDCCGSISYSHRVRQKLQSINTIISIIIEYCGIH